MQTDSTSYNKHSLRIPFGLNAIVLCDDAEQHKYYADVNRTKK